MSAIHLSNIQLFADTVSQLYIAFFKKFPPLKILLINIILNSSGNYACSVMDEKAIVGNYTIYSSSEGNIVKDGIDKEIGVSFNIQKSLMEDILSNKDIYLKRPYKLLKLIPGIFSSISIKKAKKKKSYLEGEKVILRQGHDGDIFYLVNWYNDTELNKLAGWTDRRLSASAVKQNLAKGFGYDPMTLIIEVKDGKPIGTIQLYKFDELNQSCELGIRIGDRNYWGKGYGEDSINTILKYAFYDLDVYRVALKFYEYNSRASYCYLKCGFKYEGRTRKSAMIDNKYYDEIIMGILKSDFLNSSRA